MNHLTEQKRDEIYGPVKLWNSSILYYITSQSLVAVVGTVVNNAREIKNIVLWGILEEFIYIHLQNKKEN